MNINELWETALRKERLLLITSVQQEIIDWLEEITFYSFKKNGWDVVLKGETKKEEPVVVGLKSNHSYEHVNVSVIQQNEEIFWTGVIMPRVKYQDDYLDAGESLALKNFFRTLYNICLKERES